MANSPRRGGRDYVKPPMNSWEAFERLPLPVKAALWDGVVEYDAYAVLLKLRKWSKQYGPVNGVRMTISWIKLGDKERARGGKAWRMPISPTAELGMKPIYSHEHLHKNYELVA
jgi:hypothetical protein